MPPTRHRTPAWRAPNSPPVGWNLVTRLSEPSGLSTEPSTPLPSHRHRDRTRSRTGSTSLLAPHREMKTSNLQPFSFDEGASTPPPSGEMGGVAASRFL